MPMLREDGFRLLQDAARSTELSESVNTYLDLKRMFSDSSENSRKKFRDRFARYYGLLAAGLTDAWLDCYFELLFVFNQLRVAQPHNFLLLKLYEFPRRQGDQTLQFSFVSKLVAFHDESRPLYDAKVRSFFGMGPPQFGPIEFRISGFIDNLNEIAKRYDDWLRHDKFIVILDELRTKHPELANCHSVRLCDFLVHKASAQ